MDSRSNWHWFCIGSLVAAACWVPAALAVEVPRSEQHQKFAGQLWDYVQRQSYPKWALAKADPAFAFGPPVAQARHYLNPLAAGDLRSAGAVVVTEHVDAEGQVVGVTVWRKNDAGYHPPSQDWYWAHYLPSGTVVQTCADKSPWNKRGFVVFEEDGRLWVFRLTSPDLGEFLQSGELAKCVVRPGAGPEGKTLKAPDAETVAAYLTSVDGFVTLFDPDGRLWVFRPGSPEYTEYQRAGELAKQVVRPAAGPDGVTLKAPDAETLDEYLRALGR